MSIKNQIFFLSQQILAHAELTDMVYRVEMMMRYESYGLVESEN